MFIFSILIGSLLSQVISAVIVIGLNVIFVAVRLFTPSYISSNFSVSSTALLPFCDILSSAVIELFSLILIFSVVIAEKVNVSPTPANTLLLSISSGQSLGCEYDVESAAIIFPAISTLSISGTFLSTKSE